MDWITEEQAAEAAKGSELEALKHSLKHHEQGRDVNCVELSGALGSDWNRGIFHLGQKLCAICKKFAHCDRCPIGVPYSNGNADFRCCDRRWADAKKAFLALRINPSDANIATFREAEAKVCKYIEGVIEKLEAESKKETPKLRHGEVVIANGNRMLVILKNREDVMQGYSANTLDDPCAEACIGLYTRTGHNIFKDYFDDIKRNSKDLEQFEVTDSYGDDCCFGINELDTGKGICFNFAKAGKHPHFTLDEATEIHQKLGQLLATAKRKK